MGTGKQSGTGAGIGPAGALSLITTVFLFQTLLENFIFKASYWDEAVSALFLGYFLLYVLVNAEIRQEDLIICALVLVTAAAGLYGNWRFAIQDSRAAILIDVISHFKFAGLFLGVRSFCRVNKVDVYSALKLPTLLAKFYLVILFVFGVLNLVVDLRMYDEYRYGIRTYAFIFGTSGIVTNTVLFIITLLLMECALNPEKRNIGFLAMSWALLIMVIKSRSLILAAVMLILYESLIIEKKQSMRFRAAVAAVLAGIIGYPQYQKYFVNGVKANQGRAPRLLFLEGGIQLFKEHFPFGTGFGTFGSSTAATHYSSLYYMLGFDKVTGMTPTNTKFLNDTFWPMIFAQLGLFGTVSYIFLLLGILMKIYSEAKETGNAYFRFAALFYVINVLVSSIQSSYPGNNSMIMLTFLVTLIPFAVSNEAENGN